MYILSTNGVYPRHTDSKESVCSVNDSSHEERRLFIHCPAVWTPAFPVQPSAATATVISLAAMPHIYTESIVDIGEKKQIAYIV